ncbi:MAG: sugar transferase [Oscillospiraceae bacterium]|nr:sugar transferase [Oscillospiraceae bacterium]
MKHIDFILWDVVALQSAFILAYIVRHGVLPYASAIYRTLGIMLIIGDIFIAVNFNTMHNVMKRGYYQEAIQTIKHAIMVLVVITVYMFAVQMGDTYSRITIFLTAGFHVIFGYAIRMVWKPVVRRVGKGARKAAMILVADEEKVPDVLNRVSFTDDVEYTGIVLNNRDGTGEVIQGVPVVASLTTAAEYICREWVDEVFVYPEHLADVDIQRSELLKSMEGIIEDSYNVVTRKDYSTAEAVDEKKEGTLSDLVEACRQMAIPVHIRLPLSNMGGKSFVEKVGGYTVLTTAVNYASPLQLAMKRALDILGGLVGSVIALVVIAIVGPKIKRESPGPILFKQTRVGLNGKQFKILKIRTMYLDAEERKAELLKDNRVSDGMMFKLDWDPRIIGNKIVDGKQVTGIGDRLRAGSWDEWPQFLNILKGDMSLVGTRPPTVDEWEKYKYHHRARLATKPGLTGMWQVSGRSKITDFEEVVKLDTEYINHWSIGLDFRILLKTVKAVFTKDGAM